MKETIFKLTSDHIKLATRMYVEWDDCEFGAPAIDPKRPYGNSDVQGDIAEILGWKPEGIDEDEGDPILSRSQNKKAEQLHQEMQIALQIILTCNTFEPGTYIKEDSYDSLSWRKYEKD